MHNHHLPNKYTQIEGERDQTVLKSHYLFSSAPYHLVLVLVTICCLLVNKNNHQFLYVCVCVGQLLTGARQCYT